MTDAPDGIFAGTSPVTGGGGLISSGDFAVEDPGGYTEPASEDDLTEEAIEEDVLSDDQDDGGLTGSGGDVSDQTTDSDPPTGPEGAETTHLLALGAVGLGAVIYRRMT